MLIRLRAALQPFFDVARDQHTSHASKLGDLSPGHFQIRKHGLVAKNMKPTAAQVLVAPSKASH